VSLVPWEHPRTHEQHFSLCTSTGERHLLWEHDHAFYDRARVRIMEMRALGFDEARVSPEIMHMLIGCCPSNDARVIRLICDPSLPPNSIVATI
jgi:hypothetical protein